MGRAAAGPANSRLDPATGEPERSPRVWCARKREYPYVISNVAARGLTLRHRQQTCPLWRPSGLVGGQCTIKQRQTTQQLRLDEPRKSFFFDKI